MSKLQTSRQPSSPKRSQEEIFQHFPWWDKHCLLFQITAERCDYIESRVNRVFGKNALLQQEVLEVGCGGGLIGYELAQRGALIIGIDPSENALEVARDKVQQSGLGQSAYFEQGYAESLPYADGSFSVIVCLDVLEHVRDLHTTIKEITRVLAPGGIFIFDTVNRTFLARLALIWIGEGIPINGLIPGIHDYQKFIKPKELRDELIANGLLIGEMTGFMPRGFKGNRLILGPGWFTSVSYIGYAIK
ncbi:MAG: bifunctional 2-polyprenyl-6-hydroxyphenol methylase/3-demethylubiquinol 3-O-methyltransferase UbiG [Ktedonobacteraceae bacterium]